MQGMIVTGDLGHWRCKVKMGGMRDSVEGEGEGEGDRWNDRIREGEREVGREGDR